MFITFCSNFTQEDTYSSLHTVLYVHYIYYSSSDINDTVDKGSHFGEVQASDMKGTRYRLPRSGAYLSAAGNIHAH